tara:strand:- start:187063 stop:187410 length:348 start_codon:yes stop_codon:yes gene_type:complete
MAKTESTKINDREYSIYFTYPEDLIELNAYNVKQLVKVMHYVKGDCTEEAVESYFQNDAGKLLKKIKVHLTENSQSFQGIKITYEFDELGYNIDPTGGIKLVISIFTTLKTEIKN